jgi:hypothetical protein
VSPSAGGWLKQVISGFFNYHAVPTNSAALSAFRYHVTALWLRALQRLEKLAGDWLPKPASFIPGRASGLPSSTALVHEEMAGCAFPLAARISGSARWPACRASSSG